MRVSRQRFAGPRLLVAALLACFAQPAGAAAGIPLDIIVFSGVQDLPFFVATEKGFFEEQGLNVRITLTGSSTELREGMAAGKYQIAHTAADNAVAMVELQHADTVIVMGGDNSFNHLFVTPEIEKYEDLRGKTLVVDAPNTAFALVAYQMLADHGVKRGEYTVSLEGGTPAKRIASMADNRIAQAGMLNLPYSVLAPRKGLRELGSLTSAIGQYQGTSGFVLRPWAGANRDTVVKYIAAYIQAVRWIKTLAHKAEAVAMLVNHLKLAPEVAAQCYDIVADPATGFAKDAEFDLKGFENVLKLRAVVEGAWGGRPPAAAGYLDLSFYDQAAAKTK
ncbi:ABC transporter substrate-binding protein [Bradyrhizobium sp.]|jgi:ABC-type nitrate/sulfonate/bicarbonate transport system substrate-binding protein|uniref:ABC transporter substrate-binding protein n=1 Tax=Bradyrhizobium sp. TaxID=376 RepID=UPI003C25D298